MATILAQKSGTADNVITKSDDHHDALANDPTVTTVPQGSTFGSVAPVAAPAASSSFGGTSNGGFGSSSSGSSAFGSPSAGGFGSSGSFGSSTAGGFGGGSGFGASTGGFGGTSNMGSVGTSNMNMSMGNQPVLTGAGANAAQDADVLVANDNSDWINKKWRPVMGWMYMVVCVCDFTLFPILWSVLQALSHGQVTSQ